MVAKTLPLFNRAIFFEPSLMVPVRFLTEFLRLNAKARVEGLHTSKPKLAE